MYRMFHSYDTGKSYILGQRCTVKRVMREQSTENGLLIICTQNLFEVVEYQGGSERLFLSCTASKDGCRVDRITSVNKDTQHVIEVLESLIRTEIYSD